MPASTPLFLVLTGLAAGIAMCLSLVPASVTGAGYARTMGRVALGSLVAALAYDLWFRLGDTPRPGLDGVAGTIAGAAELAAAAGWLVFLRRLVRDPAPGRSLPLFVAAVSGAGGGLAATLVLPAGSSGLLNALAAVAAVSGAAVLGTAMSAMLLGHFYLVVPGLSIDPFMLLSRVFVAIVLVRVLLDGLAMVVVGPAAVWPAADPAAMDPIGVLLVAIIPLLMRVLFGLAGALVLGIMTVKTVELHATQSATGILYAAVVFVLIGEFSAAHLLVSGGLPL
ncbi:MAG: hypothetical protein ACE5IK_08535 [Acidobacteriota bacterium]